jgi:hypothetical protein
MTVGVLAIFFLSIIAIVLAIIAVIIVSVPGALDW